MDYQYQMINCVLLLPGLLLRFDHPLNNLRLLHQECPENARFYTVTASRTAVRPANCLLTLGDGSILPRAEGRDPRKPNSTITTLGLRGELFEVVIDKFTTWCLNYTAAVGDGVVGLSFAESYSLGHLIVY